MGDIPASGGRGKEEDETKDFLVALKNLFKGERCYLGQYGKRKAASGNVEHGSPSGSLVVGSVVVTLEPSCSKLVLGAFLADRVDRAWEYWEGQFGPSELAAHRDSLGWDGHTPQTLAGCFAAAVNGTEGKKPWSSAATTSAEEEADEHRQRPPEFSEVEDKRSGDDGVDGGGGGRVGQHPGTAAIGTLDLHYAAAGIVGSWEMKRVQSGVSAALMNSMHRSIRAACGTQPPHADKTSAAVAATAPASEGNAFSSQRAKSSSSGPHIAKRQRVAGKGATLIGANSSADL